MYSRTQRTQPKRNRFVISAVTFIALVAGGFAGIAFSPTNANAATSEDRNKEEQVLRQLERMLSGSRDEAYNGSLLVLLGTKSVIDALPSSFTPGGLREFKSCDAATYGPTKAACQWEKVRRWRSMFEASKQQEAARATQPSKGAPSASGSANAAEYAAVMKRLDAYAAQVKSLCTKGGASNISRAKYDQYKAEHVKLISVRPEIQKALTAAGSSAKVPVACTFPKYNGVQKAVSPPSGGNTGGSNKTPPPAANPSPSPTKSTEVTAYETKLKESQSICAKATTATATQKPALRTQYDKALVDVKAAATKAGKPAPSGYCTALRGVGAPTTTGSGTGTGTADTNKASATGSTTKPAATTKAVLPADYTKYQKSLQDSCAKASVPGISDTELKTLRDKYVADYKNLENVAKANKLPAPGGYCQAFRGKVTARANYGKLTAKEAIAARNAAKKNANTPKLSRGAATANGVSGAPANTNPAGKGTLTLADGRKVNVSLSATGSALNLSATGLKPQEAIDYNITLNNSAKSELVGKAVADAKGAAATTLALPSGFDKTSTTGEAVVSLGNYKATFSILGLKVTSTGAGVAQSS